MYNIGTVTTTANSTKLVGTGTKWKENINLVLPMQSLQVQIGNTVYNNSIHSIQSDTELTLNFPLPASQTGAKYVIFTTTMDSISAAANAIVAMNVSNVQFSDIQNRIMTETGVIDVKLPDGTTRKTRTEAERDKLLDGKLNANYPEAIGDLKLTKASEYVGIVLIKSSDERVVIETTGDTSLGAANIIYRDKDNKNVSVVTIPKKTGTAMLIGDYGWGKSSSYYTPTGKIADYRTNSISYAEGVKGDSFLGVNNHLLNIFGFTASSYGYQLNFASGSERVAFRAIINNVVKSWQEFYTTANTTKDSNGNLKAASPIVKVFADHIELNEESEGVELEKLGTGRYKLKGVLGMNSDASWGGIHGGMVIPNGINNLPLVWGSFDVLPDGDIIIETRYRKHELNERQEAERLMTYPEFLKEELVEVDTEEGKKEKLLKVEREDYEYCDIPNGHWIDVRVNMPSNSIYNLKQAEAERLAKEEAKRAAEEAEMAAQE